MTQVKINENTYKGVCHDLEFNFEKIRQNCNFINSLSYHRAV